MPATRRRSTARKSAKAAPTPVNKSTTPTANRPEKPNLSLEDYKADFKVRWEIHSWEVKELWKDVVKGYNNSKPFVVKSYNYVKDSYNSHFNPSN